MRTNSNRFVRKIVDRRIKSRKETKDCIIWEVLPLQKLARVRIQGSSKDIYASYPISWEETPPWLKKGNIAKINFTGGLRGRIELVGSGHLRPTPYDGSDATPAAGVSNDDLLTGGLANPIPLNPRMAVYIRTGTYRINGVTYVLGPMTMGVGDTHYLGDGIPMGIAAAVVNIDAVADGYYRYDLICVGVDGVVDVVKGVPAASGTAPVLPTLPADHVQLGRVFVYPGMTAVTANELSTYYTPPVVTNLIMTVHSYNYTHTAIGQPHIIEVYCETKDQYGNDIRITGPLTLSFEYLSGAGSIYTDEEATDEKSTRIYTHLSPSSYRGMVYYLSVGTTLETVPITILGHLEDSVDEIMGSLIIQPGDLSP